MPAPDDVRAMILRLAKVTGWARSDLLSLPLSDLFWWFEGVKDDGKPKA